MHSITLHADESKNGVFADPALWRAWCWCLFQAADRERQDVVAVGSAAVPVTVAYGQFACQRGTVAAALEVPDSTARNLMQRLSDAGRITWTVSQDKQYTVVSIVSPEQYIKRNTVRGTSRPRLPKDMPGIPPELDTPEFRTAWATWLTWRQQEHKAHAAVGPQAARMALKTLATLGAVEAVRTIEYSIANGYQGIFPPKGNGQVQVQPKASLVERSKREESAQ